MREFLAFKNTLACCLAVGKTSFLMPAKAGLRAFWIHSLAGMPGKNSVKMLHCSVGKNRFTRMDAWNGFI